MQAKEILFSKCGCLMQMVEELYNPRNHGSEDQLIGLNNAIENVKDIDGISRIDELVQELRTLNVEEWKDYNKRTILVFSVFLEFLYNTLNQDAWEIEVDEIEEFRMYEAEENYDVGNIFYSSADDVNNEMILLNCQNIEAIGDFLARINNIQEMIIKALWLIDLKKEYNNIFVTKKYNDEHESKSKIEYMKLITVLKGNTFHLTPRVTQYPVVLPIKYQEDIEYAQYAEIIDVMNEYNAQPHIVDKYAKIYQVIENFMFKKLICDMCKLRNYEKLTLRDFKGISEQLQTKEKPALFSFVKEALAVIVNGKSFEDRLKESWVNCFVSAGKISTAEKYYRLMMNKNRGLGNINNNANDELVHVFCDMIYSTRCSIVHNKVNEYHITYMNLDEDVKYVIEHFLLPNMQELSYGLMLNSNDVVMYQKNCLTLY